MSTVAEKKPKFKSGSQVLVSNASLFPVPQTRTDKRKKASLNVLTLSTDREFERMLRHPTIRLASRVVTAMLLAQPWTMEGDDDDYCNYVYKQIEPYRTMIIRSAMRGFLVRGWRVFELIYGVNEDAEDIGGGLANTVAGVKPIRHQLTEVMVYEDTGEFAGIRTTDTTGATVEIDEDHCILVNSDESYIGELGGPQLRDAQETFRKWELSDKGAQRYDEKVAGGFLAIGFPEGHFELDAGTDGATTVTGADVAKAFAEGIKASGYGLYPRKPNPETGKYEEGDWKIDHIMASGSGMQPNFIMRMKYLDALMLRAFGLPERAVTEGSFGTKAEAEAHGAIAFLANLDRSEFMVHGINEGYVKPFNRANKGDENACRMKVGEMNTEDKALYSALIQQLLKDPAMAEETAARLDIEQLMDRASVPTLSPEEMEKRQAELEAKKQEAQEAALKQAQAAAPPTAADPSGKQPPGTTPPNGKQPPGTAPPNGKKPPFGKAPTPAPPAKK